VLRQPENHLAHIAEIIVSERLHQLCQVVEKSLRLRGHEHFRGELSCDRIGQRLAATALAEIGEDSQRGHFAPDQQVVELDRVVEDVLFGG